ncbi:MAG: cysteine synthase A, partial [Chloroflexi bacterium]|nr:cysteine synthase A [Chloroflexota bacterium]
LIGNTPMVSLEKLAPPDRGWASILVKAEFLNPSGSIKDRIALAIVRDAEEKGVLQPGGTIIEPTSGNMGFALALVAAARGYKLILTMPEDIPNERRKLLTRYGAELVLSPAINGMDGAVAKAKDLVSRNRSYFMARQFENEAVPKAHRETTAKEILKDSDGRVDAFVAGVGTGGTITGVGKALKAANPSVQIIAVEPAASPLLSTGRAGDHRIPGIGANFVPKILDRKVIDRVVTVADAEAYRVMNRLCKEEGLFVGPSSGANVAAALKIAQEMGKDKVVVTVLPDTGERYVGFPF